MPNLINHTRGSRAPGGRVKEFFAWLCGFWSPKYIPQRSRYGDKGRRLMNNKIVPKEILSDKVKNQ